MNKKIIFTALMAASITPLAVSAAEIPVASESGSNGTADLSVLVSPTVASPNDVITGLGSSFTGNNGTRIQ